MLFMIILLLLVTAMVMAVIAMAVPWGPRGGCDPVMAGTGHTQDMEVIVHEGQDTTAGSRQWKAGSTEAGRQSESALRPEVAAVSCPATVMLLFGLVSEGSLGELEGMVWLWGAPLRAGKHTGIWKSWGQ